MKTEFTKKTKIFQKKISWDPSTKMRYIEVLYQLFKETPILEYVIFQQVQWDDHVVKMEHDRLSKRALDNKRQGITPSVRPRKTWENEVAADAQNLMGVGF